MPFSRFEYFFPPLSLCVCLANSQLLFLCGVLLIIGPKKTYRFFFQWRKAKGTACFLGGIALVLYGWPMIGITVEGWGFLNLFGDFFPTALCAARPQQATQCALHLSTSAC